MEKYAVSKFNDILNENGKEILKAELPRCAVEFLTFILEEQRQIYEEKLLKASYKEIETRYIFADKIKKLEQYFISLQTM